MIKEVSIEIIKKCPNLCLHCSSSSNSIAKEIIVFSNLSGVINTLNDLGVHRICLSGGEPFLHPELLQIVRYISSFDIDVSIYSCGITSVDDTYLSISSEKFNELRKNGLNRVMFNLQSTNEKHYDKITNTSGHFPIVLESIKNAVSANIPVELHFVPMKINKNDIRDVINFSEQASIEQVSFLKLVPHGRAKENINKILLSYEEDMKIQEDLFYLKSRGSKIRIGLPYSKNDYTSQCHAISEKLYIRYDGYVFGCEAFKYIDFCVDNTNLLPDNISEQSIDKIVESSNHLRKSKELISAYSSIQIGCENCPVQKYLKAMEDKK